nr:hypothetical protein CFP56_09433 [Quercus suber]
MTINKPGMKGSKVTKNKVYNNDLGNQMEQSSSSGWSTQDDRPPTGHQRSPSPLAMQPLPENSTIHSRFYHGENGDIVAAEYWTSPSDELFQECRTYFPSSNAQLDQHDAMSGQAYLHVPGTPDESSRNTAVDSKNNAPGKNKSSSLKNGVAQ